VALWHQKPKRQWYFGKCVFSSAILASSVLTNGVVAILSYAKEKAVQHKKKSGTQNGKQSTAIGTALCTTIEGSATPYNKTMHENTVSYDATT
jgi:hypothetical protein